MPGVCFPPWSTWRLVLTSWFSCASDLCHRDDAEVLRISDAQCFLADQSFLRCSPCPCESSLSTWARLCSSALHISVRKTISVTQMRPVSRPNWLPMLAMRFGFTGLLNVSQLTTALLILAGLFLPWFIDLILTSFAQLLWFTLSLCPWYIQANWIAYNHKFRIRSVVPWDLLCRSQPYTAWSCAHRVRSNAGKYSAVRQ